MVINFTIEMGMFSCQDGGARRSADGIGHTGIRKEHTHPGDAVYVRRLNEFPVISRNGLVGMIIGHDEDDIGSLGIVSCLGEPMMGLYQKKDEKKDKASCHSCQGLRGGFVVKVQRMLCK